MIAYNETLKQFNQHVEDNIIADKVLESMKQKVGPSQYRALKNSLGEMYKVLRNSSVPNDVRVGIEYKIPITTRRVDFIISGSDGYKDNIVIVELKQWESVVKSDIPNVIMLGNQQHTHPSWQAYSYAATITHFNEAIDKNNIDIIPSAFLHNYKSELLDQITAPIYKDAIELAPLFIETDYVKLRMFIEKYIHVSSKKDLLYEIENGKIRPSNMLIDALGSMLNKNEEFILLDEQKVVSEYLYHIATKKQNISKKQVIIVEGGAGTGKSVIAIDLLGKLITKKAFTAFYVAKSSYVKENYFNRLTKNVPQYSYLKTLFKGSGTFIDSKSNQFNCLIVDEAHRLTERTKRSFMYYGENQIKEIINAAQVSIFFIDPKQQIDIKDYGTIEEIKKWAEYFNADIHHDQHLKLKAQFRCNGSDEYIGWVDSLLYNEQIYKSNIEIDYDIKVFDDLTEMKKAIIEKNKNGKARIISGDVFPWISRTDKQSIDIVIGNFSAQWNKTKAFASDPKSIDEVGCIHTTQGMEFEYVGLIIGDDLLYRDGKIVTDYSKHPDGANEFKRPHQRKINKNDLELIDQLIRNTYRVLMTRGQKGCYIYCMDSSLAKYLKKQIKQLLNDN
ncbi:MAG: DUF2075 domain-containing protein [Acholeplasmataceae bacterium]|nr:DUF2075 domain-containing protein [Acholeplasmataceae bacterium]